MTPRARRILGVLAVVTALLLVGRWSAEFVAERWWTATISPAAAAFVSRWQLLGVALDAGAILVATIWFAIQALLVARTITSVQVTHRFGDLQLREAVPTRLLFGGAIASGILLGLIAGAGAHAWREPMVLAWQGVTYGVVDPILNLDLGTYVAQLPAWELAHRFVVLLCVLALGFCFALYSGIGALRRDRGAIVVHADARRHLGTLLALVALTVAVGYRLAPYHLAAASLPGLTLGGALSRVRAAEVMSGVAVAAAILTLVWAFKGRNSLVAAAWIMLAVGALGERYAVPALVEEGPPGPGRIETARRFDSLAWGIRDGALPAAGAISPTITAIWDEGVLGKFIERSGGLLEAATRTEIRTPEGQAMQVWLVATPPAADSTQLDVLAVADGATNGVGGPILLRSPEEARSSRPVWRTVADPRSRPSAPEWRAVSIGVNAGSPLRRLLLSWARQAPGMMGRDGAGEVDWHLDPVERAATLLPMLSWLSADIVMLNGRPAWLMSGMLPIQQFPLATRARWREERVAGVVPTVLCTVDAASGETRFYADPGTDSLGAAWLRVVGPLIAPASALPIELRGQLSYPAEWLRAQLNVLQAPSWNAGQVPTGGQAMPIWLEGGIPALQVALDLPGSTGVATVVTAARIGGLPQLQLERRDADEGLADSRVELRQLWNRAAVLLHLRDSVTAAGDTVWSRPPRWVSGHGRVAWQTVFAVPRRGAPALLWIATGSADRIGGGHAALEAWKSVTEPNPDAEPHGPDDATTLENARRSLQRADSAFRHGDMTAFGRAFEELRRSLLRSPH